MSDIRGNLAVKPVREERHPAKRLRRPASRPNNIPVRRVSTEETAAQQALMMQKAVAIRRELTRKRLQSLSSVICAILVVAGLFGMIVYRQAMILEMNFSNLTVQRTISKLDQEYGQISESLAQKTNLDEIRKKAVDQLGLQDPAQRQIVTVVVPESDRVVYATDSSTNHSDESYLANVFSNIEGFFRTMNQQRQGD